MTIVELSPSNYESLRDREGLLVVDCWAGWCGPCRSFEPVFEQAAQEHHRHQFAKLDTVEHEQLIQELGVEHIPTLLVYRDGILLLQHPGTMSADGLADLIQQAEALDMHLVRDEIDSAGPQTPR